MRAAVLQQSRAASTKVAMWLKAMKETMVGAVKTITETAEIIVMLQSKVITTTRIIIMGMVTGAAAYGSWTPVLVTPPTTVHGCGTAPTKPAAPTGGTVTTTALTSLASKKRPRFCGAFLLWFVEVLSLRGRHPDSLGTVVGVARRTL